MNQIAPNSFAYLALLAWPAFALLLFAFRPTGRALIWTILGGYLLLPVGAMIKFEGVPAFDKNSVPSLAAFIGCLLLSRTKSSVAIKFGTTEVLLMGLMVGPFVTSELNGDSIQVGGTYGSFVLPGVGHYDALSASVMQLIMLLPFLLARRFLNRTEDISDIFHATAIAGLAYSIPMLFEVRFSPQLHAWLYGYFPHSFEQQIRDGGFRPVVFLGHGLLVAFFAMTALVAATALLRRQVLFIRIIPAKLVVAWLAAALVLCKSLGSLIYAAFLCPLVLFGRPKFQAKMAILLVTLAIFYPVLRITNTFPTGVLLDTAIVISSNRAASLKTRFDQEQQLLVHVSERPWFGWGRFGRGRVYDDTGKDISITDGHWIITMTSFGLFGFLMEFGLLFYVVISAAAAIRVAPESEGIYLAALSLIVAVGVVDLLPNASINPWSWLLAGALVGRAKLITARNDSKSVRGRMGSVTSGIPHAIAGK